MNAIDCAITIRKKCNFYEVQPFYFKDSYEIMRFKQTIILSVMINYYFIYTTFTSSN